MEAALLIWFLNLCVFQNLSWTDAHILTNMVHLAKLTYGHATLLGNGIKGFALTNFVELRITVVFL